MGHHKTYQHTCNEIPRRIKERGKKTKIMAENFPNLMKNTNIHIQEDLQTPSRLNQRDPHLDTL